MSNPKLNELDRESVASESKPLAAGWQSEVKNYGYAVVYRLGGVEVLGSGKLKTWKAPDDLLEIRAFNEGGELHAVKLEDGGFAGRVRTDERAGGPEKATPVFDELHVLWGTRADKQAEGGFVLVEDRGTKVSVPASVLPDDGLSEGNRVALKVRNYLDSANFAFIDYRFVSFEVVEEG